MSVYMNSILFLAFLDFSRLVESHIEHGQPTPSSTTPTYVASAVPTVSVSQQLHSSSTSGSSSTSAQHTPVNSATSTQLQPGSAVFKVN